MEMLRVAASDRMESSSLSNNPTWTSRSSRSRARPSSRSWARREEGRQARNSAALSHLE